MYVEYKANRPPMPEELQSQLSHLWEILEFMNIPVLKKPGVEADDIIGTLAVDADKKGLHTYIVSGDKDFMQLINDNIYMYSPGNRKSPKPIIYNPEKVIERWGLPPDKIIDFLGLMGDTADNIPGVPGVGEKTAVKLLKKFGSLESALENADKITNKRVHNGLIEGVEKAKLSKELVKILTDVELSLEIKDLERKPINLNDTISKFTELEFHAFVKQLQKENSIKNDPKPEINKKYTKIVDKKALDVLAKDLSNSKQFSINLVTSELSPMVAQIIGISLSIKVNESYYIPIQYKEKTKNNFGDNDLQYVLDRLSDIL